MKTIKIEILDQYKVYQKYTSYDLCGDLIILSGVNGSGKSQLLNIIAKNSNEHIDRKISQTEQNGELKPVENILLLSFRDNINLGEDFGQFSVTYQKNIQRVLGNFTNQTLSTKTMHFLIKRKQKGFMKEV